jgi:uncharacterized damage-inducible protein DinB
MFERGGVCFVAPALLFFHKELAMTGQEAATMVRRERAYLMNILRAFPRDKGGFIPAPGMMTAAQQVHHLARTVRWFAEGAFGTGFDMDFEKMEADNRAEITWDKAMVTIDAAYDDYIAFLETLGDGELDAPMSANPIFPEGTPRAAVIIAQGDHTAHHRGALSVYLRLLGVVPPMVYG